MLQGVDIIIVNFYSKIKIERLVDSINSSSINKSLVHIFIVNNSIDDNLSSFLLQDNITVINNAENKGFGYACNQAISFLKNDFCLLLNPDTLLFKDTLKQSIEYLQNHNDITALGVKHFNEHNTVVPSCSRFPTLRAFFFDSILLSKIFPKIFTPLFLMKDWNHLESRYVDQVMGAYIMLRKSFIDKYGLMDERYFVFLEDVDLCKKVWNNNGKVFYNTNISLIHEGASSTEGVSDKKMAYLMEGKLKYCHKHFQLWKYIFTFIIVVFIEPVFRFVYTATTKKVKVKDVFKGYVLFIKRRQLK